MLQRTPRRKIVQIFAEHLDIVLACVAKRHVARDVRREQQILRPSERMIGGQRLGHDHVERRAGKMAGIQRRNERILINGRATADVDNVCPLRQQRHAHAVQDTHRVRRGGKGHEEKIRLRQDLIKLCDGMNGVKIRVRAAAAAHAGQARGMKRTHAAGKFGSNVACAKAGDARAVERVDAYDGADYTFMEQSFGAVSAVAICASGLMGLPLAVSGLREMKILKRLRVTPVSPVFVLGVELSMYIVYCAVSLATLSVAALLWGVRLRGSLLAFLGSWALTMLSTLSVGMLAGGVAKDTKQASVIASILYFPMLVFSGTTLPIEVMPKAMQKTVSVFPLTQGISMMKNTFLGISTGSALLPIGVMLGVTALCTVLAVRFFRWE